MNCKKCGKNIWKKSITGLCRVCFDKTRRKSDNFCINCGKKISKQAIRCGSCAAINTQKVNKHPRYIDGRTKKTILL